jgi:hypothetical protein
MWNQNQNVLQEKGGKKSTRYKRRQAAESGSFPESGESRTRMLKSVINWSGMRS